MRNPPFVPRKESRLPVLKTYKLYIGGKFVRGESGRTMAARDANNGMLANYCRSSRKDFRDAVTAARAAFPGWSKQSAYLRGQILYRGAEMLEMRAGELQNEVTRSNGNRRKPGNDETALAIDRLVHYAGWTDKFGQLFSTVNPVASSHFNFSMLEPTGVVVILCPNEPALVAMVSLIAAVVLAGNTAVVLPSTTQPLPALTFSEIIATSDLPAGVVNMLAGERAELAPHFASHMDVNAIIDASGDAEIGRVLQKGASVNVKRYAKRDLTPAQWRSEAAENPYWILDSVEIKTAWHPIGL
jgi:acyl-CoA reductase-like NAD-dependent aldehyde dehydrogenase